MAQEHRENPSQKTRKSSRRSAVWKVFKLDEAKPGKAQCSLCDKWFAYKTSTSNLSYHLKTHETPTAATITTSQTLSDYQLTQQLLRWFVSDLRPISLVKGRGFIKFLQVLRPGWKPPHRSTLTRHLVSLKDNVFTKLVSVLEGASTLTLTTDCWTSIATQSYIAVTAHWIDNCFCLHSHCLGVRLLAGPHTGQHLISAVEEICNSYKVWNKIIACTTDNAANIVLGMGNTTFQHIRCAAHTLHLCALKALEPVIEVINAARKIAGFFHHSPKQLARLHEEQKLCQQKKHTIPIDSSTRWSSTYNMLERLEENKIPITTIFRETKHECPLSPLHWDLISFVIQLLKPLKDATALLSAEKYVTLSFMTPLIKKLCKKYDTAIDKEPPQISQMRKMLSEQLSARFDACNESHLLACVLDPRFRDLSLSRKECKLAKQFLTKEVLSLSSSSSSPSVSSSSSSSSSSSAQDAKKKQLSLDTFLELDPPVADDQLSRYLTNPRISCKEDPLKWWQTYQTEFPLLAQLAKRYLAYQATSVACERVFSHAGYLVSKRRTRLTPESVETLVFLYENQDLLESP